MASQDAANANRSGSPIPLSSLQRHAHLGAHSQSRFRTPSRGIGSTSNRPSDPYAREPLDAAGASDALRIDVGDLRTDYEGLPGEAPSGPSRHLHSTRSRGYGHVGDDGGENAGAASGRHRLMNGPRRSTRQSVRAQPRLSSVTNPHLDVEESMNMSMGAGMVSMSSQLSPAQHDRARRAGHYGLHGISPGSKLSRSRRRVKTGDDECDDDDDDGHEEDLDVVDEGGDANDEGHDSGRAAGTRASGTGRKKGAIRLQAQTKGKGRGNGRGLGRKSSLFLSSTPAHDLYDPAPSPPPFGYTAGHSQ